MKQDKEEKFRVRFSSFELESFNPGWKSIIMFALALIFLLVLVVLFSDSKLLPELINVVSGSPP